ncbi:MAG: 1-acyl-sn-glycerol-3-phosphate acyltransferase [Planctomycetes bacterium]|nr:1-acyl-sn-glycerol-3-phosphate acyltransferase [Planctomycetota bacterium]MBL7043480.1 1-acyl-sn-glycerol-3-phosphate acyltransferase [Pirellulaceae bacterium]
MSSEETVEPRGLTRRLVRWLVRRYYPNIKITGADRIPQSGPVLLCANHVNSLLDPVLIGIAARRPVRFMAKASLFDHPILGPPMSALGMIPAFRGQDNAREVRRNLETLDVGAKVLVEGHAMGIFPEGVSSDQAHLEKVRSGAARMAIQAAQEGAAGLKVVPIGISYERKDRFRSSAWIQVGEPVDVRECLDQHEGDGRKARRALTGQLEARLRDVVVHLNEPEWEPWLDDLQVLTAAPLEPAQERLPPLERRKRIADAMNYFLANDRERAESVASEVKEYRDQVHSAGLRIDSTVLRLHGLKVCAKLLWSFLCLILLFAPALVGALFHMAPFVFARTLAARLDQPGRKTISTNRMLVGVPLYLIWYAVVAWWTFGYFATWFAWAWTIAAPFFGLIAVYYCRKARQTSRLLWHQLRVTVRRGTLKRLRQQEADLRERLKELAEEYAKISPRPETEMPRFKKRYLGYVGAGVLGMLLLAAVAWVAKYGFFDEPLSGNGLDLKNVPEARLSTFLKADEKAIVHLIDGLEQLETEAIRIDREFADGRRSYTNQADNDDVRELLRRFVTYRQGLLRIIWKYQRCADIEKEELRLRTFLLDFTAASVLYQASLKFVYLYEKSPNAIAKLNEPEPNWGVPPGFYDTIRRNLASPQNIRMFEVAHRYYHQDHVQAAFTTHALTESAPYDRFHAAISDAEKTIHQIDDSTPEKVIKVAATDLGRLFHQVQYETQSAVSTWIGDFKIREPRKGEALIDEEQLAKLAAALEPGDVLLERRNWYLSNAFLPGYWPHGAVYVGTADDLRERGLDENEYVRQHWDEFAAKDDEGHEHAIIEAISEGVVFSSLEHSIGGADSVAVLRPRVSEEEKNEAIARAFSFAGRPYDFEFDFETTDMLVCTEVVFRTYGGNSGPISFPLEKIMGRQTMPAINLVRKFDEEYGTEDADFEFVAFIDGDEQTGTSQYLTDVQAFRDTVNRSASTFLQGSEVYALKSIGPLGWILVSMTVLCTFAAIGNALTRRMRSRRG